MSLRGSGLIALTLLASVRPAAAQTFPMTNQYVALTCGNGPMVDATGDTPNATGPLDVVGTAAAPAGFHAADAQFLYLRLRVAGNPVQGARLQANAWGFELDLDGDRSTYELLFSASGTGATDEVSIFRHPTTVTANSPADPAQLPPAFSYTFATHGQVVAAGGGDSFIDLALPFADLATLGVQRSTPVYIWAGTSTVANALDLDLACFGGAGAQLTAIDVGLTAPDPAAVGGTDGGVPPDGGTGPRTLEGGPGCSMSSHGTPPVWLVLVLLATTLWLRATRGSSTGRLLRAGRMDPRRRTPLPPRAS